MDIHIDWLSFTTEQYTQPQDIADVYTFGKKGLERYGKVMGKTIYNGTGFEAGNSRTPYKIGILREDHGCSIYGSSHTDTILFELSGRGCEALRDPQMAVRALAEIGERVTRIDIACDVRTTTRPADFCNKRNGHAFRSLGFVQSDSGETVYIGSPKSDRFCRVYRYNPPHPRSELLRCEFVFRRQYAKAAVEEIVSENGQASFVARAGNTFGFAHADWQPDIRTDEKSRAPITRRSEENTVRWLYAQCAPAIARTITAGTLDLDEFIGYIYGLQRDD